MKLKSLVSLSATICMLVGILPLAHAVPPSGITGGSNVSGAPNTSIAITDWQVTGTGTIPVHLYVPSGTISMGTTTGLTFTGSTSGSSLYFSGSLSDINTALASLHYTNSSNGTYTIEMSLVGAGQVYYPGNSHIYEVVNNGSSITASDARTAALARSINGVSGYLANITSSEENDFISARLTSDGWFGASDADVEGDWIWLDGPEAGTLFWRGTASGTAFGYENWHSGEPNQSGNEDCSEFYSGGSGWNDLPCSVGGLSSYVVEYGAPESLVSIATDSLDVTIAADSTPPTITRIASDKADGSYKAGAIIDIGVVFSEAVTSTGSVTVTLETGDIDRTCTFTITNSNTGTCNYTVQTGDTSPDLTVKSISGTIADQANNAMTDFTPGTNLAASKALVIDTTAPGAPAVKTPSMHEVIRTSTYTATGSCETGATVSISSSSLQSNPTTTTCTSGTFSVLMTFVGGAINTEFSPSFTQTDVAENISTATTRIIHYAQQETGGGTQVFPHEETNPTPTYTEENSENAQSTPEESTPLVTSEITETSHTVLNAAPEKESCDTEPYLIHSIKLGANNHPEDVKLLERFLNTYEDAGLPVDGFYSKSDFDAVVRWQEKYAKDILTPWGLKKGTGYIYIKSLAKIKEIEENTCVAKKKTKK